MKQTIWTDWQSIFDTWETYWLNVSSVQNLMKVVHSKTAQPLIFPGFYQKLCRQSQVSLSLYPLERIKELGKPIAVSSIRFHAPVEAGILHCCDPFHKELTHRLTAPFMRVTGIRDLEFDPYLKIGRAKIDVERGISWTKLLGLPFEYFPCQEVALLQIGGPFSFELTLSNIILLFCIIPVSKTSFFLEVSAYFQTALAENLVPIAQNFFELLCALTLVEDLPYMEQVSDEARNYFVGTEAPLHPSMKVISLYRQLYGLDLSVLLEESISLSA